jgi:hypothetical protein
VSVLISFLTRFCDRQGSSFATGIEVQDRRKRVLSISTGSKSVDAVLGGACLPISIDIIFYFSKLILASSHGPRWDHVSVYLGRYAYIRLSFLHLYMLHSSITSLWRIPHWKDAACAYYERHRSASAGTRRCLWEGMFLGRLEFIIFVHIVIRGSSLLYSRSRTLTPKVCCSRHQQ